jgi:hypothetical protein
MEQLMERLGLTIPEYSPDLDPVRQLKQGRVPEIGTVHIPLGTQCGGSERIYSGSESSLKNSPGFIKLG